MALFFSSHVCNTNCDGVGGCMEARKEKGRVRRIQEAKRICAGCEVREDCLAHAMENLEQFGLWGGLTERERRTMRKISRKELHDNSNQESPVQESSAKVNGVKRKSKASKEIIGKRPA